MDFAITEQEAHFGPVVEVPSPQEWWSSRNNYGVPVFDHADHVRTCPRIRIC